MPCKGHKSRPAAYTVRYMKKGEGSTMEKDKKDIDDMIYEDEWQISQR